MRFEDHVRNPTADDEEDASLIAAKATKKSAKPKHAPLPPEAEEWDKSEWVKGWAAIDPPLAHVYLRPYVFVTRDKRIRSRPRGGQSFGGDCREANGPAYDGAGR